MGFQPCFYIVQTSAPQVLLFHSLAFVVGYFMTKASTSGNDAVPLAHCISLETGMQVRQLLAHMH